MSSPQPSPSVSPLGYLALIAQYDLRCPRPRLSSQADSRVRTVSRSVDANGFEEVRYPGSAYRPRTGMADHLEFALKNEPLDDDLPTELAWLQAYDAAMRGIESWLDGEQSQLDLLVRLIVQNNGHLSRSKRPLFERLTDNEIVRTEAIVRDAFAPWFAMVGKVFRS